MSEKIAEVAVGRSSRRLVWRLAQGVIAVGIGVWRLTEIGWAPTGDQEHLLLVVLAWVLTVGGLWLIVWSLQGMRSARTPVLRFEQSGLAVERPAIGALPWHSIIGVRAQRIRSRQYLHITLGDPALIAAIHSRVQGAIVERELWFDVSDLNVGAFELAELIEEGRRGEGFTDPHGTGTPFG